jgi:hypothetical protein
MLDIGPLRRKGKVSFLLKKIEFLIGISRSVLRDHMNINTRRDQKMCQGTRGFYYCVPNSTPTCFGKWLPSSGGS